MTTPTEAPRAEMNGKPVFTVPGKTIINFASGFGKKLLCDGPVFNAGQACVYRCAFCYVESTELKQVPWFKKHGVEYPEEGHLGVVIRNKEAVERARVQLLAHPEAERMKKKVIYSSTKVDVAGNMELVRETVEICKVILELTNWDIRLLSKSNLLPKIAQNLGEWWHLEDHNDEPLQNPNERIIYGVSTGTLDDKVAAAFEEGTPKVSKRIESLHWLQDNGFRTFGMVCPSLPQVTAGYYRDWAAEMAFKLRVDRLEHYWSEVINVRGESFTRTEKCLRDASYDQLADVLKLVSHDKQAWEAYARATFEAHVEFIPAEKLRFLQYVTKSNEAYWKANAIKGAVLL